MNYLNRIIVVILSFLLMFILSCDADNPVSLGKSNKIETGKTIELGGINVTNIGATLKIENSGTALDGLELVIPENSFSTSQRFDFSFSEIKNHKFGDNFQPLTPMIQIKSNAGYSDSVLKLTIPINLPEGHFAMAFMYDKSTGKLEGLPLLEQNKNSITVITQHFSSTSKSGSVLEKYGNSIQSETADANIIVSSIEIDKLLNSGIVYTKFKPGTDDWEFANYGSFLAPGGHCAGQCITAMWYYYEKKLNGKPKLFSNYDLLDNVNYDNANGYKFASVIQKDVDWGAWLFQTWMHNIDLNPSLDMLKLLSFAYSMLITEEPQFVGIWREDGKHENGSTKYAGHALIAYGMDFAKGEIFIADPNYPGEQRLITFTNMKFNPYSAKLNAADDSKAYPFISYHAKSALINWEKIGKRWKEFENGTIGKNSPNTFPEYQIQVNKTSNSLTDGFVSNSDTLYLNALCKISDKGIDGSDNVMLEVYDVNGSLLVDNVYQQDLLPNGVLRLILKEGNNKLGLAVYAWKDSIKFKNGDPRELFVDFKWFNIEYKKPEPGTPVITNVLPASGQKGDKIKISGNDFGTTGSVSIGNKTSIVYNWTNTEIECEVPDLTNGSYQLFVTSNNKKSNSVEFKIQESILPKVQAMKRAQMHCYIFVETTKKFYNSNTTDTEESSDLLDLSCDKITWNGTSFTASYNFTGEGIQKETYNYTMNGTLSEDGKTVVSCSGNGSRIVTQNGIKQHDWAWSFSLSNIPLSYQGYEGFTFRVEGNDVQSKLSGVQLSRKLFSTEDGKMTLDAYITRIIWGTSFTPSVQVSFSK